MTNQADIDNGNVNNSAMEHYSHSNGGNQLIFSIDEGLEVTVSVTGKKSVAADESASIQLYEHRLCARRRQDQARPLFDMHIRNIDLIMSAGSQNVCEYYRCNTLTLCVT